MKLPIIILASLLCGTARAADTTNASSPQVISAFHWGGADLEPFANKWPWTGGMGGNPADPSLAIEWHASGPVSQTLRILGSDIASRVTATHFAIIGKLKYSNVAAGSYLEMLCYFAPEAEGGPEQWYFSRTLADAGPMAKLEGTDEGRDFILPFDATGAKTKLVRLVFNLHLGGSGGVELSDVKLVQYPDAPAEPNVAACTFPPGQLLSHLLWGTYTSTWADTTLTMKNPPSPSSWVEIEHTADTPVTAGNIATLEVPASFANILPLPKRFGIEGTVACENMAAGSYLEMLCYFPNPSQHASSLSFNVRVPLEGTDAGHTFALPFDSSKVPSELTNVVFNLHFGGHGKVTLKDVRLVRYGAPLPASPSPPQIVGALTTPSAPVNPPSSSPAPVAAASPPTVPKGLDQTALTTAYLKAQSDLAALKAYKAGLLASGYTEGHPRVFAANAEIEQQQGLLDTLQAERKARESNSIDWRSFLFGVAATGLSLLLITAATFVSRLWRGRQHERELRRIASLDS